MERRKERELFYANNVIMKKRQVAVAKWSTEGSDAVLQANPL